MFGLLILFLVIMPVVELFVFVQVAGALGLLPALFLVVMFSVIGVRLVKRQGLEVCRRAQRQLQLGEVPTTEAINGLVVVASGVLLALPGFVTDVLGLTLCIPAVRLAVRKVLFARIERRVRAALVLPTDTFGAPGGLGGLGGLGGVGANDGSGTRQHVGAVYDVREVDPDDSTSKRSN